MMKTWYWMQMNRNIVQRELKRIELQLARLAAALSGDDGAPE